MKKLALLMVAFPLFVASPVMAQEQRETVTTNYLVSNCMDAAYQDDSLTTRTFCLAFIRGAVNAHMLLTSSYEVPLKFCLPGSIGEQKMAVIFLEYAREQPNFSDKPAILTLYYALNNTFPCIESAPPPKGSVIVEFK